MFEGEGKIPFRETLCVCLLGAVLAHRGVQGWKWAYRISGSACTTCLANTAVTRPNGNAGACVGILLISIFISSRCCFTVKRTVHFLAPPLLQKEVGRLARTRTLGWVLYPADGACCEHSPTRGDHPTSCCITCVWSLYQERQSERALLGTIRNGGHGQGKRVKGPSTEGPCNFTAKL